MAQGIHKEIGIFAAIEPKLHFSKVGSEMFRTDSMPGSNDAALQQGECGFHGVSVDVPVHINLGFVLDRPVLLGEGRVLESGRVGVQFVSHDHLNIFADILTDILCQCSRFHILSMEEPEIAAALADADHDLLVGIAVPSLAVGVLLTAEIGFVHFDSTVHHGWLKVFHGSTDAMTEIPRGLIADAQSTLDLIGAHSLSSFAQQKHSHEPSFQREMRVMENTLSQDAELVSAFHTLEFLLSFNLEYPLAFAAQTFDAVGPAELLKQSAALFVGRKHLSQVGESHG